MKGLTKALICIGVCVAALLLPAFGLELLLPPVIALAAFMFAEWGALYLVPVLAALCLGCCVPYIGIADGALVSAFTPGAICRIAAFCLCTLLAAVFLKRRTKHRFALLALTAILCVGIYLGLTIDSMLEGKAPYAGVMSRLYEIGEVFEASGSYGSAAHEAFTAFVSAVPDTLLMFCLLAAEAMALAALLMERVWYRAFRTAPPPMARFADWRLPKSILGGSVLMISVCALAFILKLDQARAIAWTIGAALISLYSVQGMAYLIFVYEHSKAPGYVSGVTWAGAFLFLPYSAIFLTFMGIMEQVSKKRRVIAEYEKQLAEEKRRRSKADEYEIYGYIREDKPKEAPEKDDKN